MDGHRLVISTWTLLSTAFGGSRCEIEIFFFGGRKKQIKLNIFYLDSDEEGKNYSIMWDWLSLCVVRTSLIFFWVMIIVVFQEPSRHFCNIIFHVRKTSELFMRNLFKNSSYTTIPLTLQNATDYVLTYLIVRYIMYDDENIVM